MVRPKWRLEVVVRPLNQGTTVAVRRLGSAAWVALARVAPGVFQSREIEWGDYAVEMRTDGFLTEARRVELYRPRRVVFELVRPGRRFTWQGGARRPCSPHRNQIGLILREHDPKSKSLQHLLKKYDLEPDLRAGPARRESAFIVRAQDDLKDFGDPLLAALRGEDELVAAAGPAYQTAPASLFGRRVFVRFRPELTVGDITTLLDTLDGISDRRSSRLLPSLYVLNTPPGTGDGVNRLADTLSLSGQVVFAEAEVVTIPLSHGDFLQSAQWDLALIGIDTARSLLDRPGGDPQLIAGVVDLVSGLSQHPEFEGMVESGQDKLTGLYNFNEEPPVDLLAPNAPTYTVEDHGLRVAGLLAARLDSKSGDASGAGVAGVAHGIRLLGLWFKTDEDAHSLAAMYAWAAGVCRDALASPAAQSPIVSLFNTSQGFLALEDCATSGEVLREVVLRGRNGRGTPAFFSAGNDSNGHPDNLSTYAAFAASAWGIGCGATNTRFVETGGAIEIVEEHAPKSNVGHGLDLCAPGYLEGRAATLSTGKPRDDRPSQSLKQTTLKRDVSVSGRQTLVVPTEDAKHFLIERWLILEPVEPDDNEKVTWPGGLVQVVGKGNDDDPDLATLDLHAVFHAAHDYPKGTIVHAPTCVIGRLAEAIDAEANTLVTVDALNIADGTEVVVDYRDNNGSYAETFTLSLQAAPSTYKIDGKFEESHQAGRPVYLMAPHHSTAEFGETSAATPICAGVAALVLSARPELTSLDVRHILRKTAERDSLQGGEWIDGHSPQFGYGRVDAAAAVAEALSSDLELPDLMLRKTLNDAGLVPTSAVVEDSPDVWVGLNNVAHDALPDHFAGPHENPVRGVECWIYVRIHNRGSAPSHPETSVRVLVASGGHPFLYPDDWQAQNGFDDDDPLVWARGTYLIKDADCLNAHPGSAEALLPGQSRVICFPWPAALHPPASIEGDAWDPYLLVEVCPHDGLLAGPGVHQRNNLAQRRVVFTDEAPPAVQFRDQAGADAMPRQFAAPTNGDSFDVPLNIRVADTHGFDTDDIQIRVTLHRRDGITQTLIAIPGQAVTPTQAAIDAGQLPVELRIEPLAMNGETTEAIYVGAITLTAAFERVVVRVEAVDVDGHTTPPRDSTVEIRVALPSDVVLVLDYSGSMRGSVGDTTRWEMAQSAAALFATLYGALGSGDDRLGLIRFASQGVGGPYVGSDEALAAPPDAIPLPLVVRPPAGHGTPIATGLLRASALAPNQGWRNRTLVLLTDGHDNGDVTVADLIANDDPAHQLPSITDGPAPGYRVHACGFGEFEDIDPDVLQGLAIGAPGQRSYDGEFFVAQLDENPALALKRTFVEMAARALDAEVGPLHDGHIVDVEEGLDAVVFVVTGEVDCTAAAPGGDVFEGQKADGHGFSWVQVPGPVQAGQWLLSGFTVTDDVKVIPVFDLRLRTRFGVDRGEVGEPLRLWAEVRDDGAPVSGATISARVSAPAEDAGDVLTRWVHEHPIQQPTAPADGLKRRALIKQVLAGRKIPFARRTDQVWLREVSPGRYEGAWHATDASGVYAVDFEARGEMGGGARFTRGARVARHLAARPSSAFSVVSWRQIVLSETVRQWIATITPRTATGKAVGPGRPLTARTEKGERLAVEDRLDGTYSVTLKASAQTSPPAIALGYGRGAPVLLDHVRTRRVRIVLALSVGGKGAPKGAVAVNSLIAPNADPDRAVLRSMVAKPAPGADRVAKQVVFDGFVEEGATLEMLLGGSDLVDLGGAARACHRLSGTVRTWAGEHMSTAGAWRARYRVQVW